MDFPPSNIVSPILYVIDPLWFIVRAVAYANYPFFASDEAHSEKYGALLSPHTNSD